MPTIALVDDDRNILTSVSIALEAEGYPSIGCSPCTSKVKPGEDPRSGRCAAGTRQNAASTKP